MKNVLFKQETILIDVNFLSRKVLRLIRLVWNFYRNLLLKNLGIGENRREQFFGLGKEGRVPQLDELVQQIQMLKNIKYDTSI